MPATKLTTRFCDAARPAGGKQVAFPDLDVRGLELRVSGDGRKAWSYRYRTHDGRQARLSLGVYPATDLAAARAAARRAEVTVTGGGDPAAEKRAGKSRAQAQPLKTFDDLADAYLAACDAGEWKPKGRPQRASSRENNRTALRLHIRPVLGKLRLEEITRATVKALLRDMVARKLVAPTVKAHAVMRQVFAFGVAEERLQINPATGFAPLAQEATRSRVLTEDELRRLWAALADPQEVVRAARAEHGGVYVGRPAAIALQLAALLLQRRTEIAGMAVAELDLQACTWVIPGERMKGGRPHVVPLPPRAVELVKEALALRPMPAPKADGTPADQPFVFPSPRSADKPILGGSLTHAMTAARKAVKVEGATVHDLRRTGATMMTGEALSIRRFVVSKVLAHSAHEGSAVTAIYDRNEYLADKRRALEAWEGLLLQIVGERSAAPNVVDLRDRRA